MKLKKFFHKSGLAIAAVITAVLVGFCSTGTSLAYLTDKSDDMVNPFTIALDANAKVIEYFPDPTVNDATSTVNVTKLVQVANTGYIDCWVRVRFDVSDTDIRNQSKFSPDGSNSYTWDELKNHLNKNWVYNASDGYFYYTTVLGTSYEGTKDWTTLQSTLDYQADENNYMYKSPDNVINGGTSPDSNYSIITTPLIKTMTTTFVKSSEMRSYSIVAYEEHCPFYYGDTYQQAWKYYEEKY